MRNDTSRRRFLQSAAAASLSSHLFDLPMRGLLRPVSAAEAAPTPGTVQLRPEIEPLVRLLEETAAERVLEKVAERIRAGLSYQDLLAALMLAGVRNIEPRPSVGFKFHAVLVVNSAHLASLASPDEHRWLPILWAVEEFKRSQLQDTREGDWTMGPLDEAQVPHGSRAVTAFHEAMNRWDPEAVDPAVAGLARSAGANELFEIFCRYGARDFRDIGHKAIFVSNSWRTLQTVGWQHAEPVLRSLAYALTHYTGGNPAESDHEVDQPWRRNLEVAGKIRADWQSGRIDDGATRELLAGMRSDDWRTTCDTTIAQLNAGVDPRSIWDAIHSSAIELSMNQPAGSGVVPLHAVTTANALRFAFLQSGREDTRRMLLLQAAAFMPMFREASRRGGEFGTRKLDEMQGETANVDVILQEISGDRDQACDHLHGYLANNGDPQPLIDAARLLVFFKGTNSHDYKYSSATFEDYALLSPGWRERYLAASVYKLRGAGDSDNGLAARVQAALA
ncbi:MAG: hypothetical protein KDA92_18020 [Planctomycetales bacterium]|nr:hypothetical protein [Planctomycetales bacterium]